MTSWDEWEGSLPRFSRTNVRYVIASQMANPAHRQHKSETGDKKYDRSQLDDGLNPEPLRWRSPALPPDSIQEDPAGHLVAELAAGRS